MANIYCPWFRVEASKAPGDSGCVRSSLGTGGRIETRAQEDLVPLDILRSAAQTGQWELCIVHFTWTPARCPSRVCCCHQWCQVRDRAARIAPARASLPEGTQSRAEAARLTLFLCPFRTPEFPSVLQLKTTNMSSSEFTFPMYLNRLPFQTLVTLGKPFTPLCLHSRNQATLPLEGFHHAFLHFHPGIQFPVQ